MFLTSKLTYAEVVITNGKLCEGLPINNRRVVDGSITGFVCVPLALIAIGLRLFSRYKIAREFGCDDVLMCIVALLLIVLLVLDHYSEFDCLAKYPTAYWFRCLYERLRETPLGRGTRPHPGNIKGMK
jgi:hypothetical protein